MRAAALLLLVPMAWSCAQEARAQNPDWGAKSGRLALDMTEQQVMSAVGYRPNKVEMKTCGERAPHGPWTCKIYTFGGPLDSDLIVYFAVAKDGVWVVNGWDVYP